ncbi:hypothetical protein EL22_03380 [Halostagnicola sp. A56]|uniref:hypothetical protein n=1 Tax=Halostagnicola sp. A56 TaxID=1495067 RepID=UPI00049EB9EE|nr:hypothetical protein [Halostagnicola sp. A56]KDE58680.1 hypothetical protein EL22_03380 [Halostagnicola sp. A56]
MELQAFVFATAITHVGFAAFVVGHAYWTDEDAKYWPYLTLAFGLAGLAGYFFYDELEGSANI